MGLIDKKYLSDLHLIFIRGNKMAVYKRENGNWFVQFAFQGKNYIKSAKSKKKADALELERKMRDDLRKHLVLGLPKELSCEEAIQMYISYKVDSSSFVTVRAQGKWYSNHLKGVYLHQLSTSKFHELIELKKAEGVAVNTLLSYRQFILSMNKFAKCNGYMAATLDTPTLKKPRNKLRYLSYDEEIRLLTELNPMRDVPGLTKPQDRKGDMLRLLQGNYDFVVLLLDTGARLSEIINVTWNDIDLEKGCLHIWRKKVQNESILFLPDRSLSMLCKRYQNRTNEYVFTNGDGTKAKSTVLTIRNAIARAGLKGVTIHTLRHTAASRMIQNGMNLYEVKEILGHTQIETTMIYAHLDQSKITQKARDILNQTNKEVQRHSLKVVGM